MQDRFDGIRRSADGADPSGPGVPDPKRRDQDATSDWDGLSGDQTAPMPNSPSPAPMGSAGRPAGDKPRSLGLSDVDRLHGVDLPSIPGFTVVREIGSGGFGRVYEGVSTDGVGQRVAIKVLFQPSPSAARAFDNERKILANLNHPSIARYVSSGALDDGRPWMAMEFVEGMRLDKYCDREQLSTAERLSLFRKVCDAVQHAHEFGIWHLDLKPQNILVTLEGEPKLLDFGIAKVSRAIDSAAGSAHTRGFFTYLYSSPEQLRGEPLSSRSDVYNLGLILYELLTGTRVRNPEVEKIDEFVRAALQTDPEPPSLRVSHHTEHVGGKLDLGVTGTTTAQGGAGRLSRRLRGDLDNIVLMALRREPTKRYDSPKALAQDIERHLENLPVEARRASVGYRFARQLQRQRVPIAVAALVLISVTAGSIALWAVSAKALADERSARSEQALESEGTQIGELAKHYGKLQGEQGWLEFDYSANGIDSLAIARMQRDLERLYIENQRARGGVPAAIVADHMKTVYRFASACKRRRQSGDGIAALEALEPLLKEFPKVLDDPLADAFLRARLDEIHADLLTVDGRDEEADVLYQRSVTNREALAAASKYTPMAVYHLNKIRQRVYDGQIRKGDAAGALQTALAMRAGRQSIFVALKPSDDPKKLDRWQRDVMLADHWCGQAQIAAGLPSDAEASAASMLRTARERMAKSNQKSGEPYWDLALALQDSAVVRIALARHADAEPLLSEAMKHMEEAIARSQAEAGSVSGGFEIACLRASALLARDEHEAALQAADEFTSALERIVRSVPDRSMDAVIESAGAPAAQLELLRLFAQTPSADLQAIKVRSMALRQQVGALEAKAGTLPVWIIEIATARVRVAEGDAASAKESLAQALALAMRAAAPEQRVQCAVAVQQICAATALRSVEVVGLDEAQSALADIKGAALRAHFEKALAQYVRAGEN